MRNIIVLIAVSAFMSGCAIPKEYAANSDPIKNARVRVRSVQNYSKGTMIVGVLKDADDEQTLAVFTKGWFGVGRYPEKPELIGIPPTDDKEPASLPLIERFVTGNEELKIHARHLLDGPICDAWQAFLPAASRDYEIVATVNQTSLGGNGECYLNIFEIVERNGQHMREPVTPSHWQPPKRRSLLDFLSR